MTTAPPTLADAFQAVFGGPLPRPCVHCSLPTTEVVHHFTEGTGESGPYAWAEPAHDACVERMVAEAEAYAQGYDEAWEAHCATGAAKLLALIAADHGPGCDGPWNCTCGLVA